MPTNKDLKRLVRARMKKTGEAYTSARSQILRKKTDLKPVPRATADDARLAGMSDAALQEKTGRTWSLWVAALDRAGAHEWPHPKIAKHLHDELGVPNWWSQMVAVGYERIKGLREIGQRRDGAYEASKSKTFAVPVPRLFRAWKDPRTRKKWLPDVKLTIRTAKTDRSLRITWDDGTWVDAWFVSKGAAKSQVAVAHTKLTSKADVTSRKTYWDGRLRALEALLKPAK